MTTPGAAPRTAPIEVRYWSRVDRSGGEGSCWEWLGFKTHGGYGQFSSQGLPTAAAHRISYLLMGGEIPDGLVLDHLCRNPGCVNPRHLEPVTSRDNSRRSPLVLKDACAAGHPYEEGSYYMDRGVRACKVCKREQVRKYDERTGRGTQTYTCEFCGEERNLTYRSKHIRRIHPEHYVPRAPRYTPEERAQRKLQRQRELRRKDAAERGYWL